MRIPIDNSVVFVQGYRVAVAQLGRRQNGIGGIRLRRRRIRAARELKPASSFSIHKRGR
jgi:hypothetical protein